MSSRIYFGVANLTEGKESWVTLNFEAVDVVFGWAETKRLQQFCPPMGGSKNCELVLHTETRLFLAGSITNEKSRSYLGIARLLETRMGVLGFMKIYGWWESFIVR